MHLLAKNHLQPCPLSTVPARGYGDHHHQEAMALDWALLRQDANSITKVAIRCTQEGKRERGRPKATWRRTVEVEMKKMNHSWGTIQRLASDRQGWRSFVAALYAN